MPVDFQGGVGYIGDFTMWILIHLDFSEGGGDPDLSTPTPKSAHSILQVLHVYLTIIHIHLYLYIYTCFRVKILRKIPATVLIEGSREITLYTP